MNLQEQQQRMVERYRSTAPERAEIERRQAETGTPVVDSAEQVRARAEHLLNSGAVSVGTIARALPGAETVSAVDLERILGAASEMQGVAFLSRGVRAARTVARIAIVQRGRRAGFGSGFLVGERLLLTNNHVLPDPATAAESFADFDFEVDDEGLAKPVVRYQLAPEVLFLTNVDLDATLVAVKPGRDGRLPGAAQGWNRLIAQQGKIVTGEPVNIVGHPDARPKETALRDNALLNQLEDFLHYKTDTEPGNSGSPVFNDQWEVVALHHAGVPGAGGGGDWVANEGARVSVLLRWLDGITLPPPQDAVRSELGPQAQPEEEPTVTGGATAGGRVEPLSAQPVEAASGAIRGGRGIPGRRVGARQIVFLHGRGQQGHDPATLRAEWAGGLARGLAAAGLPPLDAKDAWFPYYGDILAALTANGRERAAAEALGAGLTTAEAYAPDDASARGLYAALIDEAAKRAGMPAGERAEAKEAGFLGGLVALLQRPLSWVANRSGLDDVVIAMIFRDVAVYLDREPVRAAVLSSVRETVPPDGEVVLVAHSLGTVVALDLLEQLPGVTVRLLVTAGSPLGMDSVHKRLLAGGPKRPARVGTWLNAWAAADAVAIGCPLTDIWGDVHNVLTQNRKDRAHDIDEYLSAAEVAREIGREPPVG
jgi:V8-like Glu-specific endopeptidase